MKAEAKKQKDLRDAALAIAKEDGELPDSEMMSKEEVVSKSRFHISKVAASKEEIISKEEMQISESKMESKITMESKIESKFHFKEASKQGPSVRFESSKVNPEATTTSKSAFASSTKRVPSRLGPVTVDNLKDDQSDSDAQTDDSFVFM